MVGASIEPELEPELELELELELDAGAGGDPASATMVMASIPARKSPASVSTDGASPYVTREKSGCGFQGSDKFRPAFDEQRGKRLQSFRIGLVV